MSDVEVKLPELKGEDAGDEARASFWYVEEGDEVESGDELVQMITDKATFDIESPVRGRVIERVIDEDDEAKVGQVLCRLEALEE